MTDQAIKQAASKVADFAEYLFEAFGLTVPSEFTQKLVETATPVIVAQVLYESEWLSTMEHVSLWPRSQSA